MVIRPFSETTKEPNKPSYGLSSYGYDLRLGRNYLVFSDIASTEIDPVTFQQDADRLIRDGRFAQFRDVDSCVIPPNSFALAETVEYIEVPRDCLVIVLGKSTYARVGCNLNTTPLEPAWKGIVTLEIINGTRLPLRVHSGGGIAQMLFFKGARTCETSYAEKKNPMYQDQKGLTYPKV